MASIEVKDLKTLREDLCMAQSALSVYGGYTNPQDAAVKRLQKILDQIDILRPLGSNGKHGNLHTAHCGCEDNPYLDLLHTWRVIPSFPMYELSGVGNLRSSNHSNPEDTEIISVISRGYGTHGNQELEYSLCRYEDGYLRTYYVGVRDLINETFPELRKLTNIWGEIDGFDGYEINKLVGVRDRATKQVLKTYLVYSQHGPTPCVELLNNEGKPEMLSLAFLYEKFCPELKESHG